MEGARGAHLPGNSERPCGLPCWCLLPAAIFSCRGVLVKNEGWKEAFGGGVVAGVRKRFFALVPHLPDPPAMRARFFRHPLAALLFRLCAAFASSIAHPFREENGKSSTRDWQLTRVRVDSAGFRLPWVEGCSSLQSAKAGDR